ncbi:hypothetical protein JCM19297_1294 [Nonlabens ulvanivorans]|nr:hypothetical protein JCM19297_1294 [Nonlabens ulvanivorans]
MDILSVASSTLFYSFLKFIDVTLSRKRYNNIFNLSFTHHNSPPTSY